MAISGKKIAILRRKKGLTQRELAMMIGVSREQLSRYECNRVKRPNHEFLEVLLKVLGVNYEDLEE